MAFRIDGNASGFAEIDFGRKFRKSGTGVESDFGRLLGKEWEQQRKEAEQTRKRFIR